MNRKANEELDEALSASFPASDPAASTTPMSAVAGEDTPASAEQDAKAREDLVTIYRVIDSRDAAAPFDGSDKGGRWTSPGTPALYASFSPAAAMLEFVAHLEENAGNGDLLMASARFPGLAIESPAALPPDWNERPYRESVRRVGDDWSKAGRSMALRVPSALCPGEFNAILNPRHPAFATIAVAPLLPVNLDPRLRY